MKEIYLITFVIFFNLILSACYKPAHTKFESSAISYQFDEPREYCERYLSETGIDMECKEGSIEINFVSEDVNVALEELVNQEKQNIADYSYKEINGKNAMILFATNEKIPPNLDEHFAPLYIAIIPMRASQFAIAEGFPERGYEREFEKIFKDLISTLEP